MSDWLVALILFLILAAFIIGGSEVLGGIADIIGDLFND
jgi:hypothetical protein